MLHRLATHREALASITTLASETDQGQAIANLAPVLPDDLLSDAVEFALSLTATTARKTAFLGLIPVVVPEVRIRILNAVFTSLTPTLIFGLVGALAPRFYEDRTPELVALAKKGNTLHERALVFSEIADILDLADQQRLAQEALRSVQVTDHDRIDWNDVCNALRPLRNKVCGPVLAEIAALTVTRFKEELVRRIELESDDKFGNDYFDPDHEALRQQCKDEVQRHYALPVLKMTSAAEPNSTRAIFDLVQATLDPVTAFQYCTKLAHQGADADRQSCVDAALATLDRIETLPPTFGHYMPKRDTIVHVEALTVVAQFTEGNVSDHLNQEAKRVAKVLPALDSAQCLPFFPAQDRPEIVRAALDALSTRPYFEERQDALNTIAPFLDETTVHDALHMATRVSTGDDLAPLIQALGGASVARDNARGG